MKKLGFIALATIVCTMAFASVALALPEYESSKFASAQSCSCHSVFQAQWKKSMHAQAITDPLYTFKKDQANKEVPGLAAFCDECHAPIATMAKEDVSNLKSLPPQSQEGITCDYCHQVNGVTEPLTNTAQTVLADGVKRAQLKDPVAPHAAQYSEIHTSAKFCGACHNVNHPANNLPLEATYTEWANGPYAKEGIVCQDCHMTPGVGPSKNPGTAASGGPRRDMIYNMTFAGGNTALGDAELAEERLKGAATLDVKLDDIASADSTVPVSVTITNSGAGHYLPTGLTEVRQMWLEVTATDANGKKEELIRRDFGTILEDAKGNAPVDLWNATKIKSDDRIPPKGSVTEDAELKMGKGTTKVTATLYYRSASEEVAKATGVDIPTTTMVSKTSEVYTSADAKAAAVKEAADKKADEASGTPWVLYIAIAAAVIIVIAVVVFFVMRRNKARNAS